MRTVSVIGHLDWKENNMIGAVVKARNILEELQNQLGETQVGNVDIYNWRKYKIRVLLDIVKAFVLYRNIILVCSDTSEQLMFFFNVLKRVFHNKILYAVVGGDIHVLLAQNYTQVKRLSVIDVFFVETADCVEGMKQLGISNVELLRNFKCMESLSIDELVLEHDGLFKFCTFSRVIEQKGITDAIQAVTDINREKGRKICELDIYGTIDASYKEKFLQLMKDNEAVRYCGCVDSNNAVDVLKGYYCLLFPTKYQTEGIPGTIIDGFAAGVPVICADWVRCRQLVTDGKDGIVYPFNDYEELVKKMNYAMEHTDYIFELKKGCIDSYTKYRADVAVKPLLDELKKGV